MRPAQAALSAADRPVVVSFGSPFVFDDLRAWRTGLCTFSPCDASQRAAARALLGAAEAAGKMPVKLKCAAKKR